ncbi:MAG: hypothetical protein K9N49_00470 [Candidatus Marinimicrobia bacterium]|nr:hypothetical protein [Candidatus Neomarinimicrobiota bacterium]
MEHRHLNHAAFTLAAIDDVIARGNRADWVALRKAVAGDPEIARKVLRLCARHAADPYAQRYHLWRHYVSSSAA